MAYSKVRWFSTLAFLACVGGAHSRREGANVHEGAQTAEVWVRTAEEGARTSWEGANGQGGGAHGSVEGAHSLRGRA
jgi:hypothetical protein